MYETTKEMLETYKKEVGKFWQEYFPLTKKENGYDDCKKLGVDIRKLIIMQKTLGLRREEIAEIMKEAIDKASKLPK